MSLCLGGLKGAHLQAITPLIFTKLCMILWQLRITKHHVLLCKTHQVSTLLKHQHLEKSMLKPGVHCRLMALKNIFSKQLPNMPKEYITRLVFDRRHRSVAVVKRGGQVVGGITYRPFHAQASPSIFFSAPFRHYSTARCCDKRRIVFKKRSARLQQPSHGMLSHPSFADCKTAINFPGKARCEDSRLVVAGFWRDRVLCGECKRAGQGVWLPSHELYQGQ